jgi:hypothetical protein
MNARRGFLRLLTVATPAAVAAVLTGDARADDGADKVFLGAWTVLSTVSNGFTFRELVSFGDGGVLTETNSFLHTAGNLNFAPFGFNKTANASDGVGSWSRTGPRTAKAAFRKLMFDSATGQNFGDLLVAGTLTSNGDEFNAQWRVVIVDPAGVVLADLGAVTSVGTRM